VGLVPGRPSFDPGPVMPDPPLNGHLIPLDGSAFRLLRGKTPKTPTALGCGRRGTVSRSVARSAALCEGRSIDPCRNRMPTLLSVGTWPSRVSVGHSASRVDQALVWQTGPSGPVAGRYEPSGKHFVGLSSASWRSRMVRSPAASAPRPAVAAAPTVPGFHEVSCHITSASHGH
jgi:hypothetical protein